MKRLLPLLFILGFFAMGCATAYTSETCPKIDWAKKGYDDAMSGDQLNRNALQSCSSYVDYDKTAKAYSDSYNKGLDVFCTQEQGYSWGFQGNTYRETCPVTLEKKFLTGYSTGKQQYEDEQRRKREQEEAQERLKHVGGACTSDMDCDPSSQCKSMTCLPK
jgi:hypothetical protein